MSTIKRLHILRLLALGLLLWQSVSPGMCALRISSYETDDPNDEWMWKVARNDDHAAFEKFHANTERMVIAIVQRNYFVHSYEVPDIVQNVFLRVWKGRKTFKGRFRRWLAGIAINEVNRTLQYWRIQKREYTRLAHYFDSAPGTSHPWLSTMVGPTSPADALAAVNELARRVRAETARILPTLNPDIQAALGWHVCLGDPSSLCDVDGVVLPRITQRQIDQGLLQLYERGAFDILDLPPSLVERLIEAGEIPEVKPEVPAAAPVERREVPPPLLESLRECARISLATNFYEGNLIRLLLYGIPIEAATWRLSMPLWKGVQIKEQFRRCLEQQTAMRKHSISSTYDWTGTLAAPELDLITEHTEFRIDPQWIFESVVGVSSRRTFGSVWAKLGKLLAETNSPIAIAAWKNLGEPDELTLKEAEELQRAKRTVELQLIEMKWLLEP